MGSGARLDLEGYSDVPVYTIQAAAGATSVPALTLRSWERRHGIPSPGRDGRGARLYSERDLAIVRWLRRWTQEGLRISRAVQLLKEAPQIPAPLAVESQSHELVGELLQAMKDLDEQAMNRVIGRALVLLSAEEVGLDVIRPALYAVGDLWARGELSITVERFASSHIRAQLGELMHLAPPATQPGMLLVGCAAGELHEIGPLLLALTLRRRGFNVVYAGANLEGESLRQDILRLAPSAVCLSASTPPPARALQAFYRSMVDRYAGVLVFGGRAFDQCPELVATTPGMYLGGNPVAAVVALGDLLQGERSSDSYSALTSF